MIYIGTFEVVFRYAPVDLEVFNWIANLIKMADEGDKDAVRLLLGMAADDLRNGQITDFQLRPWLVRYLTDHIKSLPRRGSRPSKHFEHTQIAIMVEICKLPREADDPPDEVRGLDEKDARDQVAEYLNIQYDTVGRYHDRHRQYAKTWIKVHGPRLARASVLIQGT